MLEIFVNLTCIYWTPVYSEHKKFVSESFCLYRLHCIYFYPMLFIDKTTCQRCLTSWFCTGDSTMQPCGRCDPAQDNSTCGRSPTEHTFGLATECTTCPLGWVCIFIYRRRRKHVIYDRLRSVAGLKSLSTPQICIHCRHYLKSRSDLGVFSNQRPFQILRSMSDVLVRVKVRAYVDDVIGHRFEDLNKYIDLRYRCLLHRNQTWIWGLDVD
jgi:hypothetical protein